VSGNNLRMRYQNEDRVDDEIQFVLDATAKFSTGHLKHNLLIGTDLIKQDSDFDRFRVNTPSFAISDSPSINFNPPSNQPETEDLSKTRWLSLYVQDQISLLKDDRLKLLLGGRFDDVVTEGSSSGTDTPDIKDQAFTGRAGVLYMLSDNHSVYFSTSQSFRPQFAFAVDINGTPLDPETGRQYELGFKSTFFNEKLLSTVSVFEIEKKNVAVFDEALFNNTGQSAFFPGVKQQSRGFEFDLAGNLTDQLKVIANYSYTDTEITENKADPSQVGLPIGGVSPHAARVWLSYNFKGDLNGLGIGGGIRYVGESTAQFDPTLELDPYRVTDIAAWYKWQNIKASINVKNLFDEDYIVRASSDAIAHYGAARTIIGSLSINF
jgi:iron complex outermembrane recepter protein